MVNLCGIVHVSVMNIIKCLIYHLLNKSFMAIEFTDATVKDIIASGEPVVIDFWATWCGPCMRLAPVIEELAAQYEGKVKIGKYNIEEENDLSTEYRIMSIPTILFFKNGEQIRDLRLAGSQTKATLEAQIEKLLAM